MKVEEQERSGPQAGQLQLYGSISSVGGLT